MKVTTTPIDGLLVIELDLHADDRGWFKENWQREKMVSAGLPDFGPVQNNISFNASKGATRGLHAEPWDKFVSVACGAVHGAWIDLRAESNSYGSRFEYEITPSTAIFVPRGVANGFQALEDRTAYTYLVNEHWSAQAEYSYTNLSQVNWPLEPTEVSEKDRHHPLLHEAVPVPPRKILVTGANGQLGRALQNSNPEFEYVSRHEFDITNPASRRWSDYKAIINCAAYTDVDRAEVETAEAWMTNCRGPARLVEIARQNSLDLIHISTDYVFDGSNASNYTEADPVSPISVYGASKAAGEAVALTYNRAFIIRTSWVIGDGKNFVATMKTLAERGINPEVVDDQVGRPTFTSDLADFLVHLLKQNADYGIYHFSNTGPAVSWFDLAQEVYERLGYDQTRVKAVRSSDYFSGKRAAPRPQRSVFDVSKAEATGFKIRTWDVALAAYLGK